MVQSLQVINIDNTKFALYLGTWGGEIIELIITYSEENKKDQLFTILEINSIL